MGLTINEGEDTKAANQVKSRLAAFVSDSVTSYTNNDEPTGALNSKSADEIMALLATVHREGTAILLVTHDAKVAARADRVLFIKDGGIFDEIRFEQGNDQNIDDRAGRVMAMMNVIGV